MLWQTAATERELARRLHPRLMSWFRQSFQNFTHAQLLAVPAILDRQSILLTSPTGSGKTLAGFLGIFDFLLREIDKVGTARRRVQRSCPTSVQCIYVSPLRALAYDIGKNLRAPIAGMSMEKEWRIHLRTGDTSPANREKFRKYGAEFLVTTPESLAVMLAQESYAKHFRDCEFVIIDELHSFAGNKRGADLTISLERLEHLRKIDRIGMPHCPESFQRSTERGDPAICRIGLSATAAPLELLARFLVGEDRQCLVAEAQAERKSIVEVFSPIRRDPYPHAGYTGVRLYAELADLIRRQQSVLVFTNVRSAVEQIGLRLKELLPELSDQIETHHAALDRSVRLEVEDRLKNGELRAVVCSTSLELGIDIGAVDLVVMVATPKGVSRAIQRIGRSGHSLNRTSHGVLVATNVNDLVEATVTAKLVRARALDPIRVQAKPFDVLAQQIVGIAALEPTPVDEVFALVRRTFPFRDLTREEFDRILNYLQGGGASLAKQYSNLFCKIKIDNGVVSLAHPRVGRDLLANIGTIVSEGSVDVLLKRRRLGSVEENFIKQLSIGDRFVLAGRVVRLVDTGVNEVFVERADGQLPTVPRWNAAKMPLTSGLARAVRQLRSELAQKLEDSRPGRHGGRVSSGSSVRKQGGRPLAVTAATAVFQDPVDWLVENYDVSNANAEAIIEQFRAQMHVSEIPIGKEMLIELYRDGERLHYFFHSLIGRSANDALSRIVAWRVKSRIGGNALATIDDYGFLLTLRPFQQMPLKEWRRCFERRRAEGDLQRALRRSELVKWQFRGVVQTGLMVARNLPGRRRERKQLGWSSEVLFRVLERHEPDHPLLVEAYRQATHTFLDADEACRFLEAVENVDWKLRELPAVSPFSFPIYASVIKESMMLEDPTIAIERIYHEMYGKVTSVPKEKNDVRLTGGIRNSL